MPDLPWGHKVTVHIYVAGDLERAVDASDCACGQLLIPTAEFVGVSIDAVQDQPKGMGDG
jgi:hypothetical protein